MPGHGARATKQNIRSVGNLVDNIEYSGCMCFRVTKYRCVIVLLVTGTCRASN